MSLAIYLGVDLGVDLGVNPGTGLGINVGVNLGVDMPKFVREIKSYKGMKSGLGSRLEFLRF